MQVKLECVERPPLRDRVQGTWFCYRVVGGAITLLSDPGQGAPAVAADPSPGPADAFQHPGAAALPRKPAPAAPAADHSPSSAHASNNPGAAALGCDPRPAAPVTPLLVMCPKRDAGALPVSNPAGAEAGAGNSNVSSQTARSGGVKLMVQIPHAGVGHSTAATGPGKGPLDF